MVDYSKKVVEFFSSGGLKLGCVTGAAKNKLQVVDLNGKNLSIAPKQIAIVHQRSAEPSTIASVAREIESEIGTRLTETDGELLWESLLDQDGAFSIEDLCGAYFGTVDPVGCSAVLRTVVEDRLRFKMKGLEVYLRSREQVEDQIRIERRNEEKEAFQRRLSSWVRTTLESDEPETPPQEMEPVLQNVEDYLFRRKNGETETWLGQMVPDLSAKEAAFSLLVRTGRLAQDSDPLLIIAGIEERFAEAAEFHCLGLTPYETDPNRSDFTGLQPFSIDDLDTREVDDALTVEETAEGTRVGIHIADVAHFVAPGDPLHFEAMRRSTSIYLPHRTVMMLPERLSSDLSSLNLNALRPTMSFQVLIGGDGEILTWELRPGQLSVRRRLSYDEADEILNSHRDDGALARQLALLDSITATLQTRRKQHGALTIRRPELKIKVQNEDVSIRLIDSDSVSRRVVSELMILANSLAAEFAIREGIPIIYRAQDPPAEELDIPEEYDPIAMDQVFRRLRKSKFTLAPQSHAGLGLEAYTQLTSPIRRLIDLIIQQQFAAHFQSRPLPYQEQDLLNAIAAAQAAETDIRAVERKANRFYVLKYLEQSRRRSAMEAVVVAELRSGFLVETADLFVRGRLRGLQESRSLGERMVVKIEKIDPEEDVLIFKVA